MWKIWCAVVLFVQLVAGAPKIGSMIGPMAKDPESMPLLTSFYTNLYAKIAREIVHDSNDTMLATIAVAKPLKGYPMIDTVNVADSKLNETSTGEVFFYLQKNDPIFANIKKKNPVTAIFSNETTQFNNETSEMESSGFQVLITGFVAQIPTNTTMYNYTADALVNRHPEAVPVLARINTILCKIEIDQVCIMNDLSGPFCLIPDDYYNADVDE